MLILKCKMCDSGIYSEEGREYDTCGRCGGTMTLPDVAPAAPTRIDE
jgi:hypothetical protein